MDAAIYEQSGYQVRCEWGLRGVETFRDVCDVLVIIDVLSFSTAVEVACSRGAEIFPYRWRDETSAAFASEKNAILAGPRGSGSKWTLSPASLSKASAGMRLVLPSLNGSNLSMETGATPTVAGCLRNAGAVAAAVSEMGRTIGLVPAGERWEDGTLRPSLEDWLGAGSIAASLRDLEVGPLSAEATTAADLFTAVAAAGSLERRMVESVSGRELLSREFEEDVRLAAAWNQGTAVPLLGPDGAYRNAPAAR